MVNDQRLFMTVNTVGDLTWVGIDCEKKNSEGKFETIGVLRAKVFETMHKAVIKKDSTTKDQNAEGCSRCEAQFYSLIRDFSVEEIYDERDRSSKKVQTSAQQEEKASAFN